MGTDYCEAVEECLDLERQRVVQRSGSSSGQDVGVELFIQKVVTRLEM